MTWGLVWVVVVLGLLVVSIGLRVHASLLESRDVEDEEKLEEAEEQASGLSRGQTRRKLVGDDWA